MEFDIEKLLEKAKTGEKLDELIIKIICMKIKEIFVNEDNIKRISTPVTCVGDTHGYYFHLKLNFIKSFSLPSKHNKRNKNVRICTLINKIK